MWSALGNAFERRPARDLRHLVQAETAGAAARIFFVLCARPFRMAARALPVDETSFHDLRVSDNQAQAGRAEDDNEQPVVMPEFQARSQAEGENEIKCRVYPSERAAVVDKLIQAVKLLPGLFKV